MLTAAPLPASVAEFVGQWWIVQAKPARQRLLVADLTARGVQAWSPTEQIRIVERDAENRPHRRTVERFVFPLYVMLCGDLDDRHEAAKSFYSARVRDIPDQRRFVREMGTFNHLLTHNAPLEPAEPLRSGVHVEVVDGPWTGTRGQVESLKPGRLKVVITITTLGASRSLEIDRDYLELV